MAILTSLGILLLVLLAIPALDTRLVVRHYQIPAKGLARPLRIMLLADHHSSRYGQAQDQLLTCIRAQDPDLILMPGDMADDNRKNREVEHLFRGLRAYGRPTYYVTGNHESRRRSDMAAVKAMATSYGITVLTDEIMPVEIGGQHLHIGGIEDPENVKYQNPAYDHKAAMAQAFADVKTTPGYRILLAHKPQYIRDYAKYGFDLVVSGHTHGGQMIIPGLINGLYAPGQGLFPRWGGGLYRHGATTMVVSRGLAKRIFHMPRVFNRPEVVVLDLGG